MTRANQMTAIGLSYKYIINHIKLHDSDYQKDACRPMSTQSGSLGMSHSGGKQYDS